MVVAAHLPPCPNQPGASPKRIYTHRTAGRDCHHWHSRSDAVAGAGQSPATGAPHRQAALDWLRVAGSKEGQDSFNPLKGSIPARTDADESLFDEYAKWSIHQFRTGKLVPSIVHGAATPNAYRDEFTGALAVFSSDLDEQALLETLRALVPLLANLISP